MTAKYINGIQPKVTIYNDLGSPVAITTVAGAKNLITELLEQVQIAIMDGVE